MDGTPSILFEDPAVSQDMVWSQQTLKSPIGCVGVGVHSGRKTSLTLHPAPAGHGIVFRRTDLGQDIQARFDIMGTFNPTPVVRKGVLKIGGVDQRQRGRDANSGISA